MKPIYRLVIILFGVFVGNVYASLSVKVDEPQSTGSKVMVKLTMKNTYTNSVESARATVFLLDEKGKVIGQNTQWVIGGTKDKPTLAPQGTALYYVTIPTDKPFQKANVIFTRIILEGGKVIQGGKGFQIEK